MKIVEALKKVKDLKRKAEDISGILRTQVARVKVNLDGNHQECPV